MPLKEFFYLKISEISEKVFRRVYETHSTIPSPFGRTMKENIFQVSMTIIKGARSNSPDGCGGGWERRFYIMNMTIYIYERCCRKSMKALLKSVAISDAEPALGM